MIKLKLIALAFCLVLSAALTAHAGSRTDAYFSDTQSGSMSGTIGTWSSPCTLESGTSTARHWDFPGQSAKVMPIAYFEMNDVLCLDFGDVTPGNHDSSPDVFRIRSHDSTARSVVFVVTGSVSMIIDHVESADHSSVLSPRECKAVRVQLAIPRDATPAKYTGWLIVRMQDSDEIRIPLAVTVRPRADKPKPHPAASPGTEATSEPSPTPSASTSPTPDTSAIPTPEETPVSTPAPAPVTTPLSTPLEEP